jgi:uncharacterized membrane protein YvlD (DUF360 family)
VIRFLISTLSALVSSALALLVAAWLIPGVSIEPAGFIVAVIVLTLAGGILGPFVFNVARQYASPVLGGIGLVTTLIALFIATLFPGGLRIDGFVSWVSAMVIVWVISALGGWILPLVLLRKRRGEGQAKDK